MKFYNLSSHWTGKINISYCKYISAIIHDTALETKTNMFIRGKRKNLYSRHDSFVNILTLIISQKTLYLSIIYLAFKMDDLHGWRFDHRKNMSSAILSYFKKDSKSPWIENVISVREFSNIAIILSWKLH